MNILAPPIPLITVLTLLTSAGRCSGLVENHTMFCQVYRRATDDMYSVRFSVDQVPPNACTDIFMGFFKVDHFRLTFFSAFDRPLVQAMERNLRSFQTRAPLVRRHLSVGMPDTRVANSDLLPIVNSLAKTKVFVHLLASYLHRKQLHGVNVYWVSLNLNAEADVNLLRFLSYMDALFREPGLPGYKAGQRRWSISVTVSGFPLVGSINSTLRDIHQSVDYLIVKAFDSRVDSRPIESYTHPFFLKRSDLRNVEAQNREQRYAVMWWEALGVPQEKLVMAYPTYARALIHLPRGVSRHLLYPYTQYNKTIIVPHAESCRIREEDPSSWSVMWDRVWEAAYMTRPRGRRSDWVFYSNAMGIQARCHWLAHYGYSGLMVWTVNMDDVSGRCDGVRFPITTAGYRCLESEEVERMSKSELPVKAFRKALTLRGKKFLITFGVIWSCAVLALLVFLYVRITSGQRRESSAGDRAYK